VSTKLKTALNSADSIVTIFKRHRRLTELHLAFIDSLLAKPSLTDADWKTIHHRIRKQRGREAGIEALVSTYPSAAWAKAYRKATA
jgi:hypothetical protein